MPVEQRDPTFGIPPTTMEGRDKMIKISFSLQDLRRRIYVKAKADKQHRFWGLYVHVCKMEVLQAAYVMAKQNNGAPGIDGITFEAIEGSGLDPSQILFHIVLIGSNVGHEKKEESIRETYCGKSVLIVRLTEYQLY
jgi:hypothetical protein